METTLILTLFKEFRDWILGIDKSNLEHNKENKNALKTLYKALSETKSYFSERENKLINRNRDKEREISNLWFEASVEIKNINKQLAERCFLKGEFWTDPINWRNNDKEKLDISLSEMTLLSKQLLNL